MLSSDSAVSMISRAPGWCDIFAQGNYEEDETRWSLYHKYHDGEWMMTLCTFRLNILTRAESVRTLMTKPSRFQLESMAKTWRRDV